MATQIVSPDKPDKPFHMGRDPEITLRQCRDCGKRKPMAQFAKVGATGVTMHTCKECWREKIGAGVRAAKRSQGKKSAPLTKHDRLRKGSHKLDGLTPTQRRDMGRAILTEVLGLRVKTNSKHHMLTPDDILKIAVIDGRTLRRLRNEARRGPATLSKANHRKLKQALKGVSDDKIEAILKALS